MTRAPDRRGTRRRWWELDGSADEPGPRRSAQGRVRPERVLSSLAPQTPHTSPAPSAPPDGRRPPPARPRNVVLVSSISAAAVLVLLVGVAVVGSIGGRDETPTPSTPRDIAAALADACGTLRADQVERLGYAPATNRTSRALRPGLAYSTCYRPLPVPPDEILPAGSLSVQFTTGRDYVDEYHRQDRGQYRIFRETEIEGVPAVEVAFAKNPDRTSCQTLVRVAEGQTLEVSVARAVPPPLEALCDMATRAATEVVANLPPR